MALIDMQSIYGAINPFGSNPSGRFTTSTINLGVRDVYAGEGIGGLYNGYTDNLPIIGVTNPTGRHDAGWTPPVNPAQGPGGLSADIVTEGKAVAEMNEPILADVTPLSTVLEEQEF